MTTHIGYSKTTGNFYPAVNTYASPPDDIVYILRSEFEKAMSRAAGESFEVIDGVVYIIPAQPSSAHDWDEKTRAWVENKARATELKQEALIAQFTTAAQAVAVRLSDEMDKVANQVSQSLGADFKTAAALMAYCGYPNDFRAAAEQFGAWTAAVWSAANAYKAEVLAGTKPMLTPDEAVALMPEYPSEK